MMFKTIDGELKVFNKTILSTQNNLKNLQNAQVQTIRIIGGNGTNVRTEGSGIVTSEITAPIAQPQTVSNFTKLNNAFKVYNGNLTKSTGLQNAYIKSVGVQNQALGNYLAGLNGAKASMGGYIAALTKAKLATIGLQVASTALNMALTMGVAVAISALFKGIDYLIHRTEKMQEAANEAMNEYQSATSNIENLNDKINENNQLIKESNNLGGNESYRKRLEAENEELQRQIALEEIKAQKAKEDADKKARKVLESKTYEYDNSSRAQKSGGSRAKSASRRASKTSGDIVTATDWYLDQAESTGVVDKKLEDYINIIKEQRENLDLTNPVSKELYDNLTLLLDRYRALYPEISNVSSATEDGIKEVNKMTVSLSDLEGASDKISKLSSAFKELADDGYITTKTLGEIQEATGLSGDEWEQYRDKLIGAKTGSSEFNQAMGELTYKMLDNAFAGRDLNSVTEEEIALLLKENGVSNSTAVAHDYLTRAKLSAKIATIDWNNATEEQIQSLYIMAQQCGITAQGMDILTQTMSILSNTDLNLADKCSALLEMAAAAGIAAASVGTASYAISEIKKGSVAGFHMLDSGGKSLDSLYESSIDEVVKTIFNKYSSLSVDIKPPKYTSGGSKGSNGSNKSDKSPFDDSYYSTVEAQIADDEKKIEALEKDREALNAKFEHAMDIGNKEQAEILRTKLSENVKAQKDILAGQNILNRGVQAELLNSLYELAPTLSGKSWDEITEVELTELENSLNKASELASDDNSKNNSKLALNKFKGIVSDLKALDDAMKDNSEAWQKLDEDSKGYWQSQIDFQEDYSKSWIDNQKSFDRMRDDEELAAYRRMIKNNKDFQKQILNDISLSEEAKLALIKETNEKINEYEKESYELEKNIVSDILSLSKSRIDSTESILQSHYNVTNSIAEAQHEINKELKASKTMYEWLDENTRKLLFNQEDYNILSNKLVNIQGEAEKLQRRYNQEVLNSTSNNLDAITSKYQMQYETLMKTYEIAKAELEVAKKRQQLDNVLNERNVRMLIDGKWRWVANTQDVINAQNELADAEYQAQQAKLEKNQTDSLNNLTKAADRLTTITNQISDGEINIRDITGNISSSLGGIATKSVPALKDIIQETKDALKNLVSDISGEKSSNTQSYSAKSGSLSKANASATIPGVGTVGVHINQSGKTTTKGLPVGTVVHTSGGDYKITGSDNDNYTSIKVKNAYANGTNHTKSGTALMGENGYEVFIDKDGNLIPVEQPTIFKDIEAGGKVFNAMQMRNLDALWNLSNIGFNPNNIPSMVDRVQAVSSNDNSTHYHGDIIIQNPADFNDFTQKLTKAIKMRAPITKNMPR